MRNFKNKLLTSAAIACMGGGIAVAADHIDAPGSTADPAADITDFYAFHQGTSVVTVLNFDGLRGPTQAALLDADVLYTIHIDTNGDNDSVDANDHQIEVRFGQDSAGNTGVQLLGIPGNGVVTGSVNTIIPIAGGSVFVGPREDPFFFDFTGFGETLATSALAFDDTRDDFAGTNVTSIILEFDGDVAFNDGTDSDAAQLWATSARITTP